jgi:NAD(P)-dependent dehydrogenase (short-subunit alcohol dehydrogenase family)
MLKTDARDDTKFPQVVKLIDEATKGAGLNLLINNAGIYANRPQTLESLTKETLMLHFEVNSVAPLLLTQVCHHHHHHHHHPFNNS